MSNIGKIKASLDKYLETRDQKYISDILETSEYIVVTATKNALKNYDMDENKYEEYVGFGYMKIADRIMNLDEYDCSTSDLYRYLYTTVTSEMVKQLEIEKNIEENNVPIHLLDRRMSELEKMGLVDDFSLREVEESIDLVNKKKAIEKMLSCLKENHRKVVKIYYGFDDGKQKTFQEVADITGLKRSYVFHIVSKSLIKMRTFLSKKGNKKLKNTLKK